MKIKLSKIAVLLLAAAVLAAPSCTDYKADITEVKSDVTKVAADLDALEADVNDLSDDLSALESKTDQLKADLAAAKKAAEEAHQATNTKIENLQKAIDTNSALIADCQKAIAAAQADIETIKAQLKQQGADIETLKNLVAANTKEIGDCKARLDALEANVSDLWARLQSMVLVPRYTDGAIDLNALFLNKFAKKDAAQKTATLLDCNSYVEYQFTPADQAGTVWALWKLGQLKASFDITSVKTRAEAPALTMAIKEVRMKDAAKGILTFVVDAELPGIEEMENMPQFAAALNIYAEGEYGADNRTSEYANVNWISTCLELDDIFEVKDGKVVGDVPELAFPYTNTEVHQFFENCQAAYKVLYTDSKYITDQYLTVDQVKNIFGVDLPVYYQFAKNEVFNAKKTADEAMVLFNTTEPAEPALTIPYLTVQLDPAKTDAERSVLVDALAATTISYGFDEFNQSESTATADIEKAEYVLDGTIANIKWDFVKDFEADCERAEEVEVPSYARYYNAIQFAKSEEDIQKDLAALGFDDKDFDLRAQSDVLYLNGEEDENASATLFYDRKDGFSLSVEDFTFENTSAYKAEISVPTPKVNLKFVTTFNTIDRNREKIVITFADSVRVFKTGDNCYTVSEDFSDELWAKVKAAGFRGAGIEDIDEAIDGFLDGTAYVHGKKIDTTLVQTPNTKINLDNTTYWAYNYTNKLPATVATSLTVTTNWGTVVEFKQNVGFTVADYNLKANSYYVSYDSEKNVYYTDVNPFYLNKEGFFDIELGLYKYVNQRVLVPELFYYTLDGEKLSDAEGAALGLSETYNFRTGFVPTPNAGGELEFNAGTLTYEAANPAVRVAGALKIDGLALASDFDDEKQYATYEVRRFEPIASFTAGEAYITVEEKGLYTQKLNELLAMTDKRGDKGQEEGYPMIKDGEWVIGNLHGANGFAVLRNAGTEVYQFYNASPAKFVYTVNIPEELEDIVKFNKNTCTLSYDHKYESQLTKPIEVTFTATAESKYHGKVSEGLGLKSTVGKVVFGYVAE